jgi:hypothetical protein
VPLTLFLARLQQRLNLGNGKKEAMPGLAQQPQVPSRIVVYYNRQVRLSFTVLLNRFYDCCSASERQIENVSAGAWRQTHTISFLQLHSANFDTIENGLVFK